MERALDLGGMQALHGEGDNGKTGDSWDGAVLEVEGFMGEQEAGRCQKASKVRLSREGWSSD